MSVRAAAACAAMVVLAVAGCGDDGEAGDETGDRSALPTYENPPMHARVEITQDGYKPKHTRILVGGTVTFVNMDPTESHTAETGDIPDGPSDNNEFDTHTLTWEEPYKIYFHKPEKVRYSNSLEYGMWGTVEAVPKISPPEPVR